MGSVPAAGSSAGLGLTAAPLSPVAAAPAGSRGGRDVHGQAAAPGRRNRQPVLLHSCKNPPQTFPWLKIKQPLTSEINQWAGVSA